MADIVACLPFACLYVEIYDYANLYVLLMRKKGTSY